MAHVPDTRLPLRSFPFLFRSHSGKNPRISVPEFSLFLLCKLPFPVLFGMQFRQADGVDTSEIDPDTMESKVVKGLYFAGEILDVDGICGGYNLQWAWTSGYLAGKGAANA